MIPWTMALALFVSAGPSHEPNSGKLPVCGNRVINAVVKRIGCTLGDARCWNRSGGFCTDYVEKAIMTRRPVEPLELRPIGSQEVQPGDIAVFAARSHYALVEKVNRDAGGRPIAVDLSEYNFGSCWIDKELMVTDKYKTVNRRAGVPLGQVDGGFLRAGTAAR